MSSRHDLAPASGEKYRAHDTRKRHTRARASHAPWAPLPWPGAGRAPRLVSKKPARDQAAGLLVAEMRVAWARQTHQVFRPRCSYGDLEGRK